MQCEESIKLNLTYTAPDFTADVLRDCPIARLKAAPADGIAPDNYHATSNHPEHIKVDGWTWLLPRQWRVFIRVRI